MARNRGLVAACAFGVAMVLLGDAVAAVVVTGRNRTAGAGELSGVLPSLESFVEKSRGLTFKRGVDVRVLDEEAFDKALTGLGPSAADPARQYLESRFLVGFLKALSLVGRDFQLSSLDAAGKRSLLGLYEPLRKRILVRAGLPPPLLRRVVVHELTHALDDQYHPLEDILIDLRTEERRALQALVEGDAERVDRLYRDQLPPASRAAADGVVEPSTELPASVGPFLDLLAFAYVSGPDFIRALVERGGTAAVDAAFRSRPTTSEDILHPDRFLAGTRPVSVSRPPADGPLLGLGILGEVVLRLVLGESLDAGAAGRAADGWGGDSYVAWSDNERTCVRVNLRMDTPADTEEVRAALRQWAGKHVGTDIRLDRDVTVVTRCA